VKETTMTDAAIEQEIQAKGLTAPRITPAHIDSIVASTHYFTAIDGRNGAMKAGMYKATEKPAPQDTDLMPLSLLTFCVLVLKNGFTVTGESACASPENFNQEIGEKIAYANAKQKVWALEGYLLKQKLFDQAA